MKKILFLVILCFSYNIFSFEKLDNNSNQQSRNGTYVMDIPEICYYEIKVNGSTWTVKFLELNTGVSEDGEKSYRSNNGIIKGNTLYDKSGDKKIGYFEDGYIVFHLLDDGTIVRKSYVYTKVNSKK
jgi:hypothetical protein